MKQGWEIKKLKEICDKITDGTHQTPKYFNSGIIFLSSKNVTSGKIDWDNVKYIDEKQHLEMHKRVAPRIGDILLAKNGTTGVAAMVDKDITFDIYVSLAHIRTLGAVIPEYLLYFINSPIAKKQFNKRLKGIGVPNLHLQEIREVEVTFPESKDEQKQIVRILDKAFAAIDQAKANIEKNIQNAQELFQSKLNEIFSQKGEGWEEKTLGEVCRVIGGGTPSKGNKDYYNGDIRWATVRDMNVDLVEETEHRITLDAVKNSSTNIIPANNVIIATRVGLGKICIVKHETAINQDLRGIIPINERKLSVQFLFRWLKSVANKIIGAGTGATVQGVKLPFIKSLVINIPNPNTQLEIVNKIDRLSIGTNRLIELYQIKIDNLDHLKKSLLQKAFSGELTSGDSEQFDQVSIAAEPTESYSS
ncbi:MAG: restriction endonuclease subunit S [Cyclobacteriaceae bacterium]